LSWKGFKPIEVELVQVKGSERKKQNLQDKVEKIVKGIVIELETHIAQDKEDAD
jgi:hypothetical protein